MEDNHYEIAMIGLGTMGRNLLLNIGDKGFPAAGFDKDISKVNLLKDEAGSRDILALRSMEELLRTLRRPRTIIVLVPAGPPVDAVIREILPFLEKEDIIIDGGNSHYIDTNRRILELAGKDIYFLGVGISGGEKGARFGPSLMPGGSEKGYNKVKHIFEAIAARIDNQPCAAYMGPGSAGHYVKMVHNGIEYAVLELIAETYHLMKSGLKLSDDEMHEVFHNWNKQKELQSFLIEITAEILLQKDGKTKHQLINLIKDSAKQKGTGKWTSQDAMNLQVPVPTIDSAVMMRDLSAYKEERKSAKEKARGFEKRELRGDKNEFIKKLGNALFFGMVISYAQGFVLLKKASEEYKYNLHPDTVASVWRAGCIIRAGILNQVYSAFRQKETLPNLLVDDYFARELSIRQTDMREVIKASADLGIPIPALMASLSYYDGYRSQWLPANLIQAQRDYFGSHGYERIDQEGIFHTEWSERQ